MRISFKNKFKTITTLVIFFLLIGVATTSAITINVTKQKIKEENPTNLTIEDDTEFYAVIVACSEYENDKMNIPKFPFSPIASWKLKSFYNSIIGASNWKEENIILLINEQATKQNVFAALDEMASRVDSNDIFLFSWQGHGSEVPDEEPFDEEDGTDEVICLYEINVDQDTNKFIGAITDDELNIYFSKINAKGMLLIFESCLSGGLVGEEFDIDKENRIIIMSTLEDTIGKASFLVGFPVTVGLAVASNQKYMFHVEDKNGDGFISAEEIFNWAKYFIFAELSSYWIAIWLMHILFDGQEVFEAIISTFIDFCTSQITAFIISGHFMLTYPNMVDNYPGELKIIEPTPKDEIEKTPGLPNEIWEVEYGVPWYLLSKEDWPRLLTDIEVIEQEHGTVILKGSACNGPMPYNYSWDMGNGVNLTGEQITYRYNKNGAYKVILRVKDDANRVNETTLTLKIEKSRPRIFDIIKSFSFFKPFLDYFSCKG